MTNEGNDREYDRADCQFKVEPIRHERSVDPTFLNPDKPQFKLTTLLVATTLSCIIAGAIATRNPLLGTAALLIVWVTVGAVDSRVMAAIERWIGGK